MRTIIDLPEEDIKTLDLIAKRLNVSRAHLIRKCVKHYLDQVGTMGGVIADDIFGTFKDAFHEDSVIMQQTLRQGWDAREDLTNPTLHNPATDEDKTS